MSTNTTTTTSVPTSTFLSILPLVVLCHRNALRLHGRSQGQVRFPNANNATTGNHLECAHSHGIGHHTIGVVVIVRVARGWCGGYYCHYYGKCCYYQHYDYYDYYRQGRTRPKSTTTASGAAENMPTEATTSPMEMETPLAIMGTTTTTANEAANSSAMDTGSHRTAATATTATTATMALTDDEEERPSNNSNYNNNNNNKNGGNSNQDGSASEALSKCDTAASSNSSSTTTTTNNKNKNPHQKTGAAAASSALQSLPAVPLPQISLVTCLDQWAAEHVVDDVRWPNLGPQALVMPPCEPPNWSIFHPT
ncbi:hypothetical protein ACA910_007384 [Epithemia clementina (nom. ined.)]